ncbi:FAS1-like dehydratase domain-containing protein [Kribbia dieselivorans]|uniref:FAS1-like dehydratase domain-containing protein n=1 Tax=Kribbia dieselivorans TaxID=331526 RepID=UPI000837AB57|nr:MaoC family dehydratase N-terminal domain-containing protein [Kribbia dieselivorans]
MAESLVGLVVDEVEYGVEEGKIREFARASFAEDPVHTDPSVAHARGLSAPAATATHVVVAGHHRDQRAFVARLGLDMTRIVVGSVRWEYDRPLLAGDRLTGRRVVIADETREGKRGGTMRLVTLETTYTDAEGQTPVRQREVLIERGAR